jgi:hypothetical protein
MEGWKDGRVEGSPSRPRLKRACPSLWTREAQGLVGVFGALRPEGKRSQPGRFNRVEHSKEGNRPEGASD